MQMCGARQENAELSGEVRTGARRGAVSALTYLKVSARSSRGAAALALDGAAVPHHYLPYGRCNSVPFLVGR